MIIGWADFPPRHRPSHSCCRPCLITAPFRQSFTSAPAQFDRLLTAILLLAAATIAVGAIYNFRLVAIAEHL